jgi:hypothetical protein
VSDLPSYLIDLAIQRKTKGEAELIACRRVNLQLRFEWFNFTNRPRFDLPNTTIGTTGEDSHSSSQSAAHSTRNGKPCPPRRTRTRLVLFGRMSATLAACRWRLLNHRWVRSRLSLLPPVSVAVALLVCCALACGDFVEAVASIRT